MKIYVPIVIRALRYFFCWGVPRMWKDKELHIKAAWFAARVTAKFNNLQSKKGLYYGKEEKKTRTV